MAINQRLIINGLHLSKSFLRARAPAAAAVCADDVGDCHRDTVITKAQISVPKSTFARVFTFSVCYQNQMFKGILKQTKILNSTLFLYFQD